MQHSVSTISTILIGYQIMLKPGTYFSGYQLLTPTELGSWSGGHDEGRGAEGVATTLCATQQVMPPGAGKVCCGMTARRPALRPDLAAATSLLRGNSVWELCLDVRSIACIVLLRLCVRFSVCGQILSLATGALFRAWTGAKRGCSQSSERQPQRAGGTDPESLAAICLNRQIAPCACLAPPCPLDSTSAPY